MDDPAAAEMWRWRLDSRRAGLGRIFDRLAAEGLLRPGVGSEAAADVAWAIASPHHYEYLVVDRGWSLKRYRAHLEDMLTTGLLRV